MIEEILDEELARLVAIMARWKANEDLPRAIPGALAKGARIVDPSKGAWQLWQTPVDGGDAVMTDSGTTWHCNYCNWQDQCVIDIKGAK